MSQAGGLQADGADTPVQGRLKAPAADGTGPEEGLLRTIRHGSQFIQDCFGPLLSRVAPARAFRPAAPNRITPATARALLICLRPSLAVFVISRSALAWRTSASVISYLLSPSGPTVLRAAFWDGLVLRDREAGYEQDASDDRQGQSNNECQCREIRPCVAVHSACPPLVVLRSYSI